MAPPPKPSSLPNPNPASDADKAKSKKKKKKVTPLQVAFLVECYLADNGFSASLVAFRSDAAHLFAKASNNLVSPKGLLPLADILDDYINLKESRLAVDSAVQALVSACHPSGTPTLPAPPPSSPPLVPPSFVGPTTSTSSPPHPPTATTPPTAGTSGYVTPMIHCTQSSSSSLLQNSNSLNANNMSTPAATLPTNKRKATKPAAQSTSASKRVCAAAQSTSLNPKASQLQTAQPSSAQHSVVANLPAHASSVANSLFIPLQSQVSSYPCIAQLIYSMGNGPASCQSQRPSSVVANLPAHASSVANSLFKPLQSQVSSYPCTAQLSYPMRNEPASCQSQRPSSVVANAHAQQEIASSQYSIVSSKTRIVSPMEGGTYYSVERGCHVSPPLKSSTQKSSKREHVKGRLDIDSSDARPVSTEKSSSSTSNGEKQDDFDIDFGNFDLFDGDFSFSDVLLDFDLDNDGLQCENPSTNAEVQRLHTISKSNNVNADQAFPDPWMPVTADPTEDINSQGATSVSYFWQSYY